MGSKWNNIKEKKKKKDKNTSRIYAKFGKEIYVAAKSGEPDPESNQALRLVLKERRRIQYLIILLIEQLTKLKVLVMKIMTTYVTKALDQVVQCLS